MNEIVTQFLQLIAAKFRRVLWHLLKIAKFRGKALPQSRSLSEDRHEASERSNQGRGLVAHYEQYLTSAEAEQIRDQFRASDDGRRLLFWTNVPRELAQAWANANGLNTLTTMMGPLMEQVHLTKKGSKWSTYIKGVSCLFAELARQKETVLVLTTPPGTMRFRPESTYLSLEEPVLKQVMDNLPLLQIDYVHPTVQDAEIVEYSHWPNDRSELWTKRFGSQKQADAKALSERVRKGQGGPHFSSERLSPLKVQLHERGLAERCSTHSRQASRVVEQIHEPTVLRTVTAIIEVIRIVQFTWTRALTGWLRAIYLCRCLMNRFHHVSGRRLVAEESPTIQSGKGSEIVSQNVVTSKSVAKPKQVKAKQKVIADHNVVDLTSLNVLPKGNPSVRGLSECDRLNPSDRQAVQKLLECIGRKELLRQLDKYSVLLLRHCKKTGLAPTYTSHKLNTTWETTLRLGKARFTSQAKKQELSKRLAEMQACRQFNIS